MATAIRERLFQLWAARVVLHRLRIRLRIGKHKPLRGDDGDARSARSHFAHPRLKPANFFGFRGRNCRQNWRVTLTDSSDRFELFESGSLVIAPQHSFSRIVSAEQRHEQQRQKGEREFPEKIKPHGFRTNSPRREPSSSEWDFPDRIRSSRGGGGRKRPRSAV